MLVADFQNPFNVVFSGKSATTAILSSLLQYSRMCHCNCIAHTGVLQQLLHYFVNVKIWNSTFFGYRLYIFHKPYVYVLLNVITVLWVTGFLVNTLQPHPKNPQNSDVCALAATKKSHVLLFLLYAISCVIIKWWWWWWWWWCCMLFECTY